MHSLPPVPTTVRHLTTEQSRHLDTIYPKRSTACVTCRDERSFLWYTNSRDIDSIAEYACPCADQFLLHRRFLHSGIHESYQRLGWQDFLGDPEVLIPALDYLDRAEDYVDSGSGMVIWGDKGNGKSMVAMLMGKALVMRGIDVYANTFVGLIDAFAEGWRDQAERAWFNRRVRNADVLLVDDIGRERNKGTGSLGQSALEEVLRHRASRSMPTIITTNVSPEDMDRGYGGHTMSLLSERAQTLHFSGQDYRTQIRERGDIEREHHVRRPVLAVS